MFQAAQKLGGYEVVSVYTICLKSSAFGSTLFPLALKDSQKNKSLVFFSSLPCNVCLLDPGLDAELSQIQIWLERSQLL